MTKGFDELIVSAALFSDYKMFIEYSNKAEKKIQLTGCGLQKLLRFEKIVFVGHINYNMKPVTCRSEYNNSNRMNNRRDF